jgi:hypothetical protein
MNALEVVSLLLLQAGILLAALLINRENEPESWRHEA